MEDKAKWFQAILDADSYKGRMEADFFDRWPFFHHFGCDPYDGSIEVYFTPDCPADWSPSAEDMAFLAGYGVTFGWLNFTDGTEIHVHVSTAGPRKPVQHPRWSAKAYHEAELGRPLTDEEKQGLRDGSITIGN